MKRTFSIVLSLLSLLLLLGLPLAAQSEAPPATAPGETLPPGPGETELSPAPGPAAFCGGSRASASSWEVIGTGTTAKAQLRGSTVAEVATLGRAELAARWVSGRMYGTIPGLGDVVVRVLDQDSSFAHVTSKSGQGVPFFPAIAHQSLFWAIDVVDAKGQVKRTLVNREPMVIEAEIRQIPPYGTPFPVRQDVLFYDQKDLVHPVVTLKGGQSLGILQNVGGLKVRLLGTRLDPARGTFVSRFRVDNVTSDSTRIHWFATGVHGTELQGQAEARSVSLGSPQGAKAAGNKPLRSPSIEVTVRGSYDPNEPDAGLAFHATTAPGETPAEGHTLIYLQSR